MVIALRLGLLYHQREIFYDYDWRTKWEVILLALARKIWFIVGRGYLYSQDGDSFGLVAIASAIEFAITLLSGVIVVLFTISYAIFDLSNPAYYVSLAAIAGFIHYW